MGRRVERQRHIVPNLRVGRRLRPVEALAPNRAGKPRFGVPGLPSSRLRTARTEGANSSRESAQGDAPGGGGEGGRIFSPSRASTAAFAWPPSIRRWYPARRAARREEASQRYSRRVSMAPGFVFPLPSAIRISIPTPPPCDNPTSGCPASGCGRPCAGRRASQATPRRPSDAKPLRRAERLQSHPTWSALQAIPPREELRLLNAPRLQGAFKAKKKRVGVHGTSSGTTTAF